jgi:hypothetical protein
MQPDQLLNVVAIPKQNGDHDQNVGRFAESPGAIKLTEDLTKHQQQKNDRDQKITNEVDAFAISGKQQQTRTDNGRYSVEDPDIRRRSPQP